MSLTLREETPDDYPAIYAAVTAAFGQQDEAQLVDLLREGGYVRLSLVAEEAGRIVGHVLYSTLAIEGPEQTVSALALAPMAVVPDRQSLGIGSALVRESLDICRQRGHRIVIVLGHPHYYPRFGFSPELAKPLQSPYAGDAFMALELVPGSLSGVRGKVQYAPPFSAF